MLDSKGSSGARPDRDDPRPHQRRQELVVFADRQQRDIEPCRPRFTVGMTGADRLGDDQHAGHRPLEFEEAALHVVPTRHQTQAAIALLPHPACGLARVAERVVGIVAEDDTARITIGMPGDAQQFDPVDMRVDAGNEQLLRPSGAEQVEPRLNPQSKTPYGASGRGSSSMCPAGPRITTVSAAAAPPMTPPRKPNPSAW